MLVEPTKSTAMPQWPRWLGRETHNLPELIGVDMGSSSLDPSQLRNLEVGGSNPHLEEGWGENPPCGTITGLVQHVWNPEDL